MTFTLAQALKAQASLRAAANLPDEDFSEQEFVGMISDEIRELRAAGRTDADISELLHRDAQVSITPESITTNYRDTSEWKSEG